MSNVNIKLILLMLILLPFSSNGRSLTKILEWKDSFQKIIKMNDELIITYSPTTYSDTLLIVYSFNLKTSVFKNIYSIIKKDSNDVLYYDNGTLNKGFTFFGGLYYKDTLFICDNNGGILKLNSMGNKLSYNPYYSNCSYADYRLSNNVLQVKSNDANYKDIYDLYDDKGDFTRFEYSSFDFDTIQGYSHQLVEVYKNSKYLQAFSNGFPPKSLSGKLTIVNYDLKTKKTIESFFPDIKGYKLIYGFMGINDSSYIITDEDANPKTFEKRASIFLTNDYGRTFDRVLHDSIWYKANQIIDIASDGDSTILAGCNNGTYYYSKNKGRNWSTVDSLPNESRWLIVRSIVSTEKNVFYFIAANIFRNSFLYKLDLNDKTDVKEEFENSISIYPNPSKDYLYIKLTSEGLYSEVLANEEIEVYDLMGQNLLVQKIDNIQRSINIQNLNTGIYYAKLKQNGTVFKFEVVR